jgi:K+-sensing histidine kinase KdpD
VTASLYGGFRAGVAAVVLSLIAGDYLFIEPRYTFFIHDTFSDSVLLISFSALGVALGFLTGTICYRGVRANSKRPTSALEWPRTRPTKSFGK